MAGVCGLRRRRGTWAARAGSASGRSGSEHPAAPAAPPPGRDWLWGGPAEPAPANGRPRAVRMRGCGRGRAFPGRGARLVGPWRSRVVREGGNLHRREAACQSYGAWRQNRCRIVRVHVGSEPGTSTGSRPRPALGSSSCTQQEAQVRRGEATRQGHTANSCLPSEADRELHPAPHSFSAIGVPSHLRDAVDYG